MSKGYRLAGLCLLSALSNPTYAGWVLFHQQGETGKREAYFAEITRIAERTEIDNMMGATSIWELPVMVVHEAATAPEWRELKLQFECQSTPYSSSANVDGWNDPVNMRIAARSYIVPRVDLSNRPLPETQWARDNRVPMIKAQKFACLEEAVRNALQVSIAQGQFDINRFNTELQNIGLVEPVHPLEARTAIDLLDLSWNVLWKGSKRPDPSGLWVKKLSPQEKARNEAQYAAIQKIMDDAVQMAEQ
jgi:hypothetical protein